MSLTYGFFNSVDGDRMYNAIQVSSIFDGIIEDGIFGSIGDAFQVLATTGLGVSVGTGRAWFNHTWTYNDALIPIVLDSSDPILPRYDAIILEVDESVGVRANSIKKVTGTPATVPAYPTLTNTEYVHQYPLAYILVNGGATSITQVNITNMIGQNSCPFVIGPLSAISTNDLIAQWEEEFNTWFSSIQNEFDDGMVDFTAEFNAWFDEMKDQLSEDAAGNLQLQINEHDHSEVGNSLVVGIANNAVNSEQIGNEVLILTKRQGNSGTNWQTVGGYNNYDINGRVKSFVGVGSGLIVAGESYQLISINFPEAFASGSGGPIINVQPLILYPGPVQPLTVLLIAVYPALFQAFIYRNGTSGDLAFSYHWSAIGPA
jgi:hypothetical protein